MTQPSTENTTNEVTILEHNFWVAQKLNNKGRLHGFGSEWVIMNQQSH